ncbi:MAG: DUF362 domain-containing protein [Planctomycetota bacterium]|nr:DUF362 domain-containing protein [Planctomycetota bacterium]
MASRKATRREFLKGAAVAAAAVGLSGMQPTFADDKGSSGSTTRVVQVTCKGVFKDGKEDPEKTRRMLAEALCRLTDKKKVDEVWQSLFKKEDVVGVKVNTIAGHKLSSSVELTKAVCEGIASAGVAAEKIMVWDRHDRELKKAGFTLNSSGKGFRCFGTDSEGHGYEVEIQVGSAKVKLSRILADEITALVNLPILKDHGGAGMTAALKNHYGSVDQPGALHGGNCNPFIADLNKAEPIAKKTRLIVCDCFKACCDGGPAGNRPKGIWEPQSILVATDPVALDAVGFAIIEERRKECRLEPIAQSRRNPKWLATAAGYGLGVNDLAKIDWVKAEM